MPTPTEVEPSSGSEAGAVERHGRGARQESQGAGSAKRVGVGEKDAARVLTVGTQEIQGDAEGAVALAGAGSQCNAVDPKDAGSAETGKLARELRLTVQPIAGTAEAMGAAECRGAPVATCEAALGVAPHPDVVPFNSAMWACLGDPIDALSALGG